MPPPFANVQFAEVFPRVDPLAALAGLPGAFALRSSLTDAGAPRRQGRWTFFGAEPFACFRGGDSAVAQAAFRMAAAASGRSAFAAEIGIPVTGGAVGQVRAAIAAGEIFQANLSQRWRLPWPHAHEHAVALDAALAAVTPAPFAATLCLGDHTVLSASPELFLRRRGARIETRPIKGTRPRGDDAAEDARLAAELLASAKDRAENVMIVDVLRNDLGRVCEPGSVHVPELCALERFPQVWHLTSTVLGTLEAGLSPFELLHACFPGGSITGAPKLRAMEILDSLEP